MIIINNEELLRRPCADATPEEVGELIELLERELENSGRLGNPGIGLAAPQIGILKKVAIVRINKELSVNLVNCNIEKGYDLAMFKNEGCLSFPGRIENTMRFQEVYIANNLVSPSKFVATGLLSVVIQHELDHLNGTLLPDKAIIKIPKLDRNDLCFCGSNKKYKRCHGKQ